MKVACSVARGDRVGPGSRLRTDAGRSTFSKGLCIKIDPNYEA